jgi:glycosyltransferase involved in cell wall biosynthesis
MNINVIAPINQLGYGICSLNIVKELSKDSQVSLFVIGQPQVTNQLDADIISKCIQNSHFFDYKSPSIKIWHQHDMAQSVGSGKRIGFPIFELDTFTELEQHQLSSLDSIFVCSEWAKGVVLNNIKFSPDNIHVIPLGVDMSIFEPHASNNNTTKFFNCGKWEIRKGHDVLVDWFNDAFTKDDNVELYMMCSNPFLTEREEQEWINLYKKSKLGSKIVIIPRQQTQLEVYNIMKNMDVGIFPSRAEGWNLELLEIMSCGKTVITTNYSAHTEFCNNKNSFLIDVPEIEKAFDGKWFHGQGHWAKLNNSCKDQAIAYMRQSHYSKKSLNQESINTAKKFTWNHTARRIVNVI